MLSDAAVTADATFVLFFSVPLAQYLYNGVERMSLHPAREIALGALRLGAGTIVFELRAVRD